MVITSITGTLRRTLNPQERDDVETWLNLDPRCVPERTLQSNFEPRNTFLNCLTSAPMGPNRVI